MVMDQVDRLCPLHVAKCQTRKGSMDALQAAMTQVWLVVPSVGADRLCLLHENHLFSNE